MAINAVGSLVLHILQRILEFFGKIVVIVTVVISTTVILPCMTAPLIIGGVIVGVTAAVRSAVATDRSAGTATIPEAPWV